MMTIKRFILLFVFVCVASAGCDTTVTPVIESEPAYTMWGLLDMKTGEHGVRVFEIDDQLRLIQPESLNVAVLSIDMSDGETRKWTEAHITQDDGTYRHLFTDSFDVQPGHTYRIETLGNDGGHSFAEVTAPPFIDVNVLPPNPHAVVDAQQTVEIHNNPPSILRIEVDYYVNLHLPTGYERVHEIIRYEEELVEREGHLEFEVDYARDYQTLVDRWAYRYIGKIDFIDIEARIHVGDESWISPIGEFDLNFMMEPGAFSNVSNGFGFVGAGYIERHTWMPPVEVTARAGFGQPIYL